jgi:hypothetical protein
LLGALVGTPRIIDRKRRRVIERLSHLQKRCMGDVTHAGG